MGSIAVLVDRYRFRNATSIDIANRNTSSTLDWYQSLPWTTCFERFLLLLPSISTGRKASKSVVANNVVYRKTAGAIYWCKQCLSTISIGRWLVSIYCGQQCRSQYSQLSLLLSTRHIERKPELTAGNNIYQKTACGFFVTRHVYCQILL